MFSHNDKISVRQLQALLILDIFGVGVITLPRKVAEIANQDGWILVALGVLATIMYLYFICSVGEKYLKTGFVDGVARLLSKPVAYIIACVFIVKIIIGMGLELRIFGEIVKEVMLNKTPIAVTLFMMLAIGGYGAYRGYEVRGRLGEVLLPFVIIPIVFLICLSCVEADFTNIMPVLVTKGSTLIKGAYVTSLSFYGAEYVLLSYVFLANSKGAKKGTMRAVGLIGVIMVALVLITTVHFGIYDVKRQQWPVLGIMDAINLPGSFIERQGVLVMSIWILSTFFIINAGVFFSSVLLKDVIKKGEHNKYILLVLPVIFLIALLPRSVVKTYSYLGFVNLYFDSIYLVILPIILWIRGRMCEKA